MFRRFHTSTLTGLVFVVFSLVMFFLFSCVYQNKQIKHHQEEINRLSTALTEIQRNNEIELLKLNERLSIVDASIAPDNKKWVRIKQVRKVIVDTIKQQGTNTLTILEITEIARSIIESSEENDVSVGLILSITTVESAFKIDAVSKAGAKGLMQLLPDTAKEISLEAGKRNFNLFRIKDNIQLGSYYLWKLNNLFGDLDLAISAYNCGPTCVERVKSREYADYPKETIDYLKKVKEWKLKYDNLGVN